MTSPETVSSSPHVFPDQVNRHQHAHRRHHFRRQHPQQHLLRTAGREERHRVGRRYGQQQTEHGHAHGNENRIPSEHEVVAARKHLPEAVECRGENQRRWNTRALRLERRDRHPEDREEQCKRDDPREHAGQQALDGVERLPQRWGTQRLRGRNRGWLMLRTPLSGSSRASARGRTRRYSPGRRRECRPPTRGRRRTAAGPSA